MKRGRRMAWTLALVFGLGCQGSGVELPVIGGSRLTDEQQIAYVLDDVHRGMESRRIYKVLAHVSRNYQDQAGRDYVDIQAYLNDLFQRYRQIRITRTRPRIWVQGNQAQALEVFGTSAEAVNSAVDLDIHLQGQVIVYLEWVDGSWKIREWGPIQ